MNLEQRLAKISTVDDAENQIRLAKAYTRTLRTKAQNESLLADKLVINEKLKEAEQTLRNLRRYIFDIEDAIAAGKPALSLLNR